MREIIIIVCMTIIYFIIAFLLGLLFDILTNDNIDEYIKNKKIYTLFIEIVSHICIIYIIAYFIRSIVEHLAYPIFCKKLDNKHIKELNTGAIFTFVILFH